MDYIKIFHIWREFSTVLEVGTKIYTSIICQKWEIDFSLLTITIKQDGLYYFTTIYWN